VSLFTADELRAQLRAQQIPEYLIEKAVLIEQIKQGTAQAAQPIGGSVARNMRPDGTHPLLDDLRLADGADDARLEKEVVARADKQLRALGFRVINTSQPRHAKYITPGVPDRFYFHRARGLGFAWEAKTATGEQSPAQRDFQEDMDACGWLYVLGTDVDLFAWLLARYPLVVDESGHLIWRPE
jgi:hypothetical protein